MTDDTPTTTKALNLPTYDVWLATEDGTGHRYVGAVTVRNVDQLTAEKQAKAVRVNMREEGFHVTNLWLWAACIRLGETKLKFGPFTEALEWSKVGKDEEEDLDVDPTFTAPGVSTD